MVLTSCGPSRYEEVKPTSEQKVDLGNCVLVDIKTIPYNGHSYILFRNNSKISGVIHDPDCSCHKTNETDFGF